MHDIECNSIANEKQMPSELELFTQFARLVIRNQNGKLGNSKEMWFSVNQSKLFPPKY